MEHYLDSSNTTEPLPVPDQARAETVSVHASLLVGAIHGSCRQASLRIDHEQVRSRESVMAELLVAARMTRRRRLSRLAEVELSRAGQDLSTSGLVATAHLLRHQCIALGMPACRYRDLDWRRRGLE